MTPHSRDRPTAREWSAYCDGRQDGIGEGYALALADVVADLRQASWALLPLVPDLRRAIDTQEYRRRRADRLAARPEEPAHLRRRRIRASWDLPTDHATNPTPSTTPTPSTVSTRGAAA